MVTSDAYMLHEREILNEAYYIHNKSLSINLNSDFVIF